jgi:hypothetical protein
MGMRLLKMEHSVNLHWTNLMLNGKHTVMVCIYE